MRSQPNCFEVVLLFHWSGSVSNYIIGTPLCSVRLRRALRSTIGPYYPWTIRSIDQGRFQKEKKIFSPYYSLEGGGVFWDSSNILFLFLPSRSRIKRKENFFLLLFSGGGWVFWDLSNILLLSFGRRKKRKEFFSSYYSSRGGSFEIHQIFFFFFFPPEEEKKRIFFLFIILWRVGALMILI